jgi:cytochrome oxidase Cu insertion factor (SCO1/SenC/PrrC family)
MTSENEGPRVASEGLSVQERSAAFTREGLPVDRAAAFRAGRTPIPPKFIAWMLVGFVVLGLGGAIVEHYFGNFGTAPTMSLRKPSTTTPILPATQPPVTLSEFIGLKQIGPVRALPFTLRDQSGQSWSVTGAKGKVIVLAFYNSVCNDICPVLGSEIRQSITLLGPESSNVEFVIVNTDPRKIALNDRPRALTVPKLINAPSVYFLTGPLRTLDAVWTHYGITVKVGAKANDVEHNNLIYFIDPEGRIESLAAPFGKVSGTGAFRLDATDTHRFAEGIAQTASSLVK